jgi:hypothetical protein
MASRYSVMFVLLGVVACGATTREHKNSDPGNEPANGSPDDVAPSQPGVKLPPPDGDHDPPASDGGDVIELELSNCPDAAPALGSSCDAPPLLCSYGDSSVAGCRTYVQCTEKSPVWEEAVVPTACTQVPPEKCPEELPSGVCPIDDEDFHNSPCVYPGGAYCYCEAEGWDCRAAPPAGCPESSPNFGDACEQQGLSCKYGDPCRGGFVTICRRGYWQPVGVGCAG